MEREDALTPTGVRAAVNARDGFHCRICGVFEDRNALHHIEFRSGGGADTVANLITLCWLPWQPDCHLQRAHRRKRFWQPILRELVATPGITGLQLVRWRGVR